ncbi:uncharacterized protein LOC117503173 isoform X2 [Thalassophryne amazonica]|uniref:uncharacterized protein LOC117503173 isoform X2 n=1 Tax=Thalassophryne amazonica TaxID=390379 RepID=UPI001472120B|nr:uncharacterized protein LOC117503173 isoform X2 [Thalassophryne amazonica]
MSHVVNTYLSLLGSTAQYSYGDTKGTRINWRVVRHCRDIPRSWCDLTNETWDLEEGYYARVRAIGRRAYSKWVLTQRRFDPILDTTLGPPLVSVEIEDNTAIITMKGPMRYQPNNITPEIPMKTFYHEMTYNISIHNTHKHQMRHILMDSSTYIYRMMEYATEYCFSARTRLISMPIWCQPSEWHCITTPPDPLIGQLQRVIASIVVPSLCICLLSVGGYFLFNYLTGKGKSNPDILADTHAFHHYPPILSFEKTNFISTSVMKDQPTLGTCSYMRQSSCSQQKQHIRDSPPVHSSYGPPSELEEPLEEEVKDYGFVQAALQISVGEEGERNEDVFQSSYEIKERITVALHSIEVATLLNTSMSADRHTDMTKCVEMQPLSQVGPVFFPQSQASATALQGEMATEKDSQECLVINIKKDPTTGSFKFLLDLQGKPEKGMMKVTEGATEKEMVEKVNEIVHAGAPKNMECEKAPFLSSYALQHIPNGHVDQPDCLPDDYGILRLATEQGMEKEEEEEEEEEMVGVVDEITHAAVAKNAEFERAPLLSGYASQHIPNHHVDQPDGLPDDYGILRLATEQGMEKKEEEEEKEMIGVVHEITHATVAKNAEFERAPLLSGYASQHIPNCHVDQPDGLPDDYGILILATEQGMEKEEEEEEAMDEGTYKWAPETGNPMLAQIEESTRGGSLKDVAQGEKERGEEEETQPTESRLRLDGVFSRQWVDDLMAKWDLVISLAQ